jgi:hypothetical protein
MKPQWDTHWTVWEHDPHYECRIVIQYIKSQIEKRNGKLVIDYCMLDGTTHETYIVPKEAGLAAWYKSWFERGLAVVGRRHAITIIRRRGDASKQNKWVKVELLDEKPVIQPKATSNVNSFFEF